MRFKILKRIKPGRNASSGYVYYPYPVRQEKFELDDIADQISKESTMSRADVYGVLTALIDVVTDKVSEGSIVYLGNLGSFKLNLKHINSETENQVTAKSILGCRLVFQPAMYIKSKLRKITFNKA